MAAAGIISAGFSASTGLQIMASKRNTRTCSGCNLDASQCSCGWWRTGVRFADNLFFGGLLFVNNKERLQESFPYRERRTDEPEDDHAAGEQAVYGQAYTANAVSEARGPPAYTLTVKDLFAMTIMTYTPTTAVQDDDQPLQILVYVLKSNRQVSVELPPGSTVRDLRIAAAAKLGLPRRQLKLFLNGSQIDDYQEMKDLAICQGSMVYGMKCHPGEETGIFELDCSNLDPIYDFDFTHLSDDGKTYWRGGHVYHRPYGWKRNAVKVHGEYDDDVWLGGGGIRTEETPGEWAVSYHGTDRKSVKPIVEEGYKIGPRDRFGPAVYSSPSLQKIEEFGYTKTFSKDGKTYKFALQNRVNPNELTVIPPNKTGYDDFLYWLSPMQDPEKGVFYVRPYGMLTKEI